MPTYKFKQGDDKKLELLMIKDELALDIQDAISVKANLVVNGKTQKVYSKTPTGEEGTLTVPISPVNQINLFIERDDSKLFVVGSGYIDVLLAFEDLEFPDGNFVENITVGRLQVTKGQSLDIDIP